MQSLIIVPCGNWVTKVIVMFHQVRCGHTSVSNHTLANLSKCYWVMQFRGEIRKVEKDCKSWKIRKAKATVQWWHHSNMFDCLAIKSSWLIDYCRPFITIQGRGRKWLKPYLCLFSFLTSHAVYLEILFTDPFLNIFYKITNGRSVPLEMMSCNGTNFVGADREIMELVKTQETKKINRSRTEKGIRWHISPPRGPHFGGAHKSLTKSSKKAVKAILSNADITVEDLVTVFMGVESLLNSRPLTCQTANPEHDVPLTLNHFQHC